MDNHQRQPSSAWLERVLNKLIDNTIGADVVEEDKEALLENMWELVTRHVEAAILNQCPNRSAVNLKTDPETTPI